VENAENTTDKSTQGQKCCRVLEEQIKLWKAVGFSAMGIIGTLKRLIVIVHQK
jgi:hypothetical protein